jgi:GLPGLI family protein
MTKQLLVLVCFCLVFTSYVFAQQKTSGVIYYTQEINTKAMRMGADGQQQASRPGGNMPDKITNKMEIIYNANGAKLQKSEIEEDISQTGNTEGRQVMRFGGNADREVFFNFADKKVTESFEMNGEQLLLEKTLGSTSSDILKTDQTKKIAGFECKKITVKDKAGAETTVWYTTDLPLIASPVPALWTEGVVLGVENQRMKYYASSIEYTRIKDSELALPKKAKMISEEEYNVKQAEFRKKMQEQFRNRGGNGNQMIIREGGN